MKTARYFLLSLIPGVLAATAWGQVIPTNVWADYYGRATLVNSLPAPTGSIVQAFDQSGVLCGQFTVVVAGQYGFMPVYGDDFRSTDVDEGLEVGEQIVFRINGKIADKLGPGSDLWPGQSEPIEIDLAILQNFAVSLSGPDEGLGYAGTVVNYTIEVNNDGDGIDLFVLGLSSALGWTVSHDAPAGGFYVNAGESREVLVSVSIPGGAPVGQEDELTLTVTSQLSPSTIANKLIITTVDQLTSVDESNYVVPGQFSLNQNYPNPFNPQTVISFNLERAGEVSLDVFDILGRRIAALHAGYLSSGEHQFVWNGADQYGQPSPSGIYFYRLTANGYSLTRKMALLK